MKSHGIFAGRPDPPDFTRRGNPTHRILAFGKWGTYKRLELLIEAFNRVATKLPNVELVIGGGDHPKTAGYVQSMAQLHANDRIHFLGYVPEDAIADLFREASLAVMPYTSSAGSSGVAHLAAQYGVPVIASGIRDFRDLAEHEGIAMRFFTPGDTDSLVEEMLLALNSPDRAEGDGLAELCGRRSDEHAAGGAGIHPLFPPARARQDPTIGGRVASRGSIPKGRRACPHRRRENSEMAGRRRDPKSAAIAISNCNFAERWKWAQAMKVISRLVKPGVIDCYAPEHGFFTVAVRLRPSSPRRARLLKKCCPYRALPLLRCVRRGSARTGLLLPRSSPWQSRE